MTTTNRATERLRSIDELEKNILGLARQINVATYELLVLVREFDERVGFLKWSMKNSVEWLSWRIDISMSAAREKVRVAHALKVLPEISFAFKSGELSYSKVRAMTRVANAQNEQDLIDYALRHTAEHVEQRCRELRFGRADSTGVAERAFANRSLRISRNAERGTVTLTVELPVEMGELVDKALDKARDDSANDAPEIVETSWQAKQADAFVSLVNEYLLGDVSEKSKSTRDNYLMTIHVDQSALTHGKGRSSIPIETAKRLCCDGHAVTLLEANNGQPLAVSKKKRVIALAVERAVRARDHNRCRFPGCSHTKFTDCHHIDHWVNGGESTPDNLLLLCTRHHTLVHEGQFQILKDFQDNWFFARPDGTAIPTGGYHPEDTTDEDIGDITDAYLNPSAEGFLSAAENIAKEPPPPLYLH